MLNCSFSKSKTFSFSGRAVFDTKIDSIMSKILNLSVQQWRAVRACKSCVARLVNFCAITFILLLNKKDNCFGTKFEKCKGDSRRRLFFVFWRTLQFLDKNWSMS